eukprot:scaffold184707_cov39-Prasinocladus_malaysianus.AAC.1
MGQTSRHPTSQIDKYAASGMVSSRKNQAAPKAAASCDGKVLFVDVQHNHATTILCIPFQAIRKYDYDDSRDQTT